MQTGEYSHAVVKDFFRQSSLDMDQHKGLLTKTCPGATARSTVAGQPQRKLFAQASRKEDNGQDECCLYNGEDSPLSSIGDVSGSVRFSTNE